jgi:SagB-type dehydrogenase family enzyme
MGQKALFDAERGIAMDVTRFRTVLPLCMSVLVLFAPVFGQESKAIQLPEPQTGGGKPLMQTLKERKSSRAFSEENLSTQTLSDLLWAAFGVSRPDSGKRTAPSTSNWQQIDVYVATAQGLYLYDAQANALKPILSRDIRALTGKQAFVKDAPVNLVYVADFSKADRAFEEDKILFGAADAGLIAENVYLFCASEGLATVVRAMIDKPALAEAMKLRPEQHVILAQTVGHPRN